MEWRYNCLYSSILSDRQHTLRPISHAQLLKVPILIVGLSRFQNFTGRVGPSFLRSSSGITGRVKISFFFSTNFSNRQFGIIVYLRFNIMPLPIFDSVLISIGFYF
jgi:hypothetical protein